MQFVLWNHHEKIIPNSEKTICQFWVDFVTHEKWCRREKWGKCEKRKKGE